MLLSCLLLAELLVIMPSDAKGDSISGITHSNGLTLTLNQALDIEETSDGFRVRPVNFRHLRSPMELTISLKATLPEGEWPGRRQTDGEIVHYRTDQEPGGSGGTEETLSLWKQCTLGYVLIRQRLQAETPNQMDFSLGWYMASNVSCVSPSGPNRN
jgi:hypothetical protein